jgi:hypothetical protein
MVHSGMCDAGYVYVNLDDGWQAPGAKFEAVPLHGVVFVRLSK